MSDKIATKEDLQEMYSRILPYLNRQEALANASILAKIGTNTDGKPTFDGELLSVPNNGQFDKLYNFSTTEQVVGKWTNGKPIYQKLIDCGNLPTVTSETNKTIAIGATIDEIIDFRALGKWTTTSVGYFNTEYWYSSADSYIRTYVHANSSDATYSNVVQIQYKGSYTWLIKIIAIVRYTKTTDTANSFNYAGENDYSTSEKIVGTWIDGKPLYQKTINFGTLGNATKKAVAHNISNLKTVVSFKASAWGTTGGVYYAFLIPNVGTNNQYTYDIAIDITGANIDITTQTDRTWLTAQVTLQYTKTTD